MRAAVVASVLFVTAASAAPPYLFRVVGSLDAGVGSPSEQLHIFRLFPDGGVAGSGEPPLSTYLYAPPGGDLILFDPSSTPVGAPGLALNFAGNSASTPAFFVRMPSVGTHFLRLDAGTDALVPFEFDMHAFAVSHRQTFEFDAGTGFTTSGEFHDVQLAADSRATIDYASAAAHEGDSGYFFTFAPPATVGSGFAAYTVRYYLPLSGELHVRTWVRVPADNGQGEVNLFNLHANGPTGSPVADYALRFPEGRVVLSGHDRASAFFYDAGVETTDGGWFLAQLSLSGMNSAAGRLSAYVDGRLAVELGPLDWTGMTYRDLTFGVPWVQDKQFVGTLLFDELAVMIYPPPTFLRMTGPGSIALGACVQYLLRIENVNGMLAPPHRPYDVNVTVDGGSATVFVNSNCTAAANGPFNFPPGQTINDFYVRATTDANLVVEARTPDLLGATFAIVAGDAGTTIDAGTTNDGGSTNDAGSISDAGASAPDAGVDAGTSPTDSGVSGDDGGESSEQDGGVNGAGGDLDVGCGCHSAPFGVTALLVLAMAARRRRASLAR